jgi:O-antigen/teichoic acid export membrane protein
LEAERNAASVSFLSNVLRHGSYSVASGLIGAVGSFAATVIVARLLGVEGTAAVAMALWLVFLTTAVSDVGITGTLSRFVAEYAEGDGPGTAPLFAAYLLRLLLLAIAGGLILTAGILWLYWGDIVTKYAAGQEQALVFCGLVLCCFVVHMLFAFAFQFLRGLRQFKTITYFALAGSVLQIVGVAAGSLYYGVNGALVGYIVFSLPMIFGLRRVPLFGASPRPEAARTMRHYGLTLYFAFLFSPLLWVRADLLIVDQAVGEQGVGLFAAAGTIAALLLHVCSTLCHALLPNIVHVAKSDRAAFERASRIAVRLTLALLLPACLIAAAAAPEALTTVFGAAFAEGGWTAAILCLAGTGSALTLVIANIIGAGTSNIVLARNGVIGALVTVASGTVLALAFGLIGAALGRLFSQAVIAGLNVRSANRQVAGLVTFGWLVRILLASALGGLATEAVGWWLGGGFAALFLSLAVGGLVYLCALLPLLPLGPGERELVLERIETLPNPFKAPAAWLLSMGRKA